MEPPADEHNPNLLRVSPQRRFSSPYRTERHGILHYGTSSTNDDSLSQDGARPVQQPQSSPPAPKSPHHSMVHYSASVRGSPSDDDHRQRKPQEAQRHTKPSLGDTDSSYQSSWEPLRELHKQKESLKSPSSRDRPMNIPYSFKRRIRQSLGTVPSQVMMRPFLGKRLSSSPSESDSLSSNLEKAQSGSSEASSLEEDKKQQVPKLRVPHVYRPHKRWRVMSLCCWLWEEISKLCRNFQNIIRKLTSSRTFDAFIAFIIYLNIATLVTQTFISIEIRGEWYFIALDAIYLSIYLIEAVLKIIALGPSYFSDPWNKLDFFIMTLAVLDFLLVQYNYFSFTHRIYNQTLFRIFKVLKSLRALRAIRVMWKLSFLSSLQKVTRTLARSLTSITAILILMFTCPVLFSAVFRALFRYSDPKHFQNLFTTFFTLFTLLTLDDWSLIYLHNVENGAWHITPMLMIYVVIQYFIFLNLVIAVLVDNFQMALLKGQEQENQAAFQELDNSVMELALAESSGEPEGRDQRQMMEKKFGAMTENLKELMVRFLQLTAAVELYQQKFRSQGAIIDEIVDKTFEAREDFE